MCHKAVLQRMYANQVIHQTNSPLKRCIPSASRDCKTLTIGRVWVSSPWISPNENAFLRRFNESKREIENYQIGFLNHEQTRRINMAVEELILATGFTGSKWNIVLQIDWPTNEEELITLEKGVKEFPRVLNTAILKADKVTHDGKELDDSFNQLTLSGEVGAQEGSGIFSGGRLFLSSETSLGAGGQDYDLVADLESLMLT